jgi:tRNA pseudouridine38-40 synthase
MAQGSKIEDTVREIKYCDISRCGDMLTLRVAADGFLYNMVRIIVGTAIMASKKKLSFEDISRIIESCDRKNAGPTAPPSGLYLNKVFY